MSSGGTILSYKKKLKRAHQQMLWFGGGEGLNSLSAKPRTFRNISPEEVEVPPLKTIE